MSQRHIAENADIPHSSPQSCPWSFVLNQHIGLTHLAIPASHWAAGAWFSAPVGRAGPLHAGSYRTTSLRSLRVMGPTLLLSCSA